jgi:hypothetical protein
LSGKVKHFVEAMWSDERGLVAPLTFSTRMWHNC